MLSYLRQEIDGIIARDPAAKSRFEVVLTYPSFHAMLFYRVAHWFYGRRWFVLARFISNLGRFFTDIEIHPGARIGRRFFADHGQGVVVGETAEIGDDVTLYQGVTLGGVSPSVDSAAQIGVKRHPTLESGVIVGAGAMILGPITVGPNARVGSNAVVVRDVQPGVTVAGIPARVVRRPKLREADDCGEFSAYAVTAGDAVDPTVKAVEALTEQVAALQARVAELERERAAEPRPRPQAVF
jgi:serine O-acetyltransferase